MDVLNESGNEVNDITFKKIMPFGGMVQVLKYHVIAIIVFQSRVCEWWFFSIAT